MGIPKRRLSDSSVAGACAVGSMPIGNGHADRHIDGRDKNRLRSVVVAMNKADLVDDARIKECEAAYKEIMDRHWKVAGGPLYGSPAFRRCVAVANEDGTRWVDAILVHVAKRLSET